MAVADEDTDQSNLARIKVNGARLEEVEHFQYLGVRIQNNGDNGKEIKCWLAMGLKALNGMKNLWQGQDKQTKL